MQLPLPLAKHSLALSMVRLHSFGFCFISFGYICFHLKHLVNISKGCLLIYFKQFLTLVDNKIKTLSERYLCMHIRNMIDRKDNNHHHIPWDWSWHANLEDMYLVLSSRKPNKEALAQQMLHKDYFNDVGSVPWQEDILCDIIVTL